MEKGKISVQTAHILPIIKKWLYSEKEIFVRELISNAFDAISKVKKVSLSEDIYQADQVDFAIDVKIDRENNVLIIEDNGIGMDLEEIKNYITQIAFSGARDFISKYEEAHEKEVEQEDKKEESGKSTIIGNFGIGFYSAFMVSKRVEIDSRSYQPGAKSAYWSSEGDENYEIGEGQRSDRGTTIRLHLEEGESEFLDNAHVSGLIRRYCDFIPVPIRLDGAQVNRQKPLWSEQPSSLKKEDYDEFYKYTFPMQGDPLFYIHLNVDYPFKLQGILYFPRMSHELDFNRSTVKIYCKQIFVSDEAQDLIPQYLTVLQGMIDLPDLPLNVSRSYLQNEPQIKKIANHVVKKVADRLNEEFKKRRTEYETIWPDIALFVKFGLLNDAKFYDQVKDSLLLELASPAEGARKFVTLDEYVIENKAKTDGRIFYVTDPVSQAAPLQLLKEQGIEVVLLNTMIDNHFIQFMESKNNEHKFVRIDSELSESLLDSTEKSQLTDADGKDLTDNLTELFKKSLANDKIQLRVESLKSDTLPAMILLPEQSRRFSEMTAHMTRQTPAFLDDHTLLLNSKNELIKRLSRPGLVGADGSDDKRELAARQVYFLARLTHGNLDAETQEKFVAENYNILEKLL